MGSGTSAYVHSKAQNKLRCQKKSDLWASMGVKESIRTSLVEYLLSFRLINVLLAQGSRSDASESFEKEKRGQNSVR